ncbi:MAG: virulence factor Mce family protein [Mycobacterium sp.]|nr:virulence factor Mce family protein [Mycobacterium sp.]
MRTLGRHPLLVGLIGAALIAVLVLGSLNYDKLPFFNQDKRYSAYFAEAGGLAAGAPVQVSGFQVGKVSSVELDGPRVLVKFGINRDVRLGDRTEASTETKTVLGAKILEITPRGDGELDGPIPIDRTRSAYQLPDALGDLASTISGLNTDQLSDSLSVLATTFHDSAPDLRIAVQGVARYSKVLNARDEQLRNLLANANKVTGVLAERSDRVVSLIADANALLLQLQGQSRALDDISANISAVSRQIQGFIGDNRQTLKPALDKLNGVLAIVDNHKEQVQKSIKLLNSYSMSLGESVASGPFFKAYVTNLLPGQFLQPFIDAAFSDLGLDPNVLAPTKLNDPQVGQPGTPALPIPFPRTGQGGEPNLNLPDAITGKPGDQGCGPPGMAMPGPTGCYPYREPPAAPPPGGPPPGPPAPGPAQPPTPEPTLGEPPPPVPGGAQ